MWRDTRHLWQFFDSVKLLESCCDSMPWPWGGVGIQSEPGEIWIQSGLFDEGLFGWLLVSDHNMLQHARKTKTSFMFGIWFHLVLVFGGVCPVFSDGPKSTDYEPYCWSKRNDGEHGVHELHKSLCSSHLITLSISSPEWNVMEPFPTGLVFDGGKVAGPPQTERLRGQSLLCAASPASILGPACHESYFPPCRVAYLASSASFTNYVYGSFLRALCDLVCDSADCIWCLPVAERLCTQHHIITEVAGALLS